MISLYVFTAWLFFVILWNFGYPNAEPIWDVVVAVALSLLSTKASRMMKK